MTQLLDAFRDPDFRNAYMIGCFVLLWLPMVGLAIWYHLTIRRTRGGRALMERQAKATPMPRTSFLGAQDNVQQAFDIHAEIQSGRYGDEAKRLQHIVYWVVGVWLALNTVAFGLLIWADEVNRPPLT